MRKNGGLVASYGWDQNSNRVTYDDEHGSGTATYDAQDRLLTYGTSSYVFDGAGDLVSKNNGGFSAGYDYDEQGNLRTVTPPSGPQVEYVVDAANRRIGTKIGGTLVQGLLYGGQLQPVAELDGSGGVVSRFVYGTGGNVPDYLVRGGATYRLVKDHLGSVRLVIDASSGEVVQRIDYDAFGRILQDSQPGWQPFGYAGGLYDFRTGLVRFGARDYDPETGRWTAKDPIGFGGGDTNLYGYVLGDPVNLTDPSGEIVPLLLAAWGAVEVGLTVYDAIQAYRTLTDDCASGTDKAFSAGGLAAGMFLPGGGYGRAASGLARNRNVYEVFSEQAIRGTTRSAHRAAANRSLFGQLEGDAQLRAAFDDLLGGDVVQHMRSGSGALRNPPGTVWHHPANNPGAVQLLRATEHTNPGLQPALHPDGIGGFGNFYGGS